MAVDPTQENQNITSNIYTNNAGKITGAVLQAVLLGMVAWVVANFAPIASPTFTGTVTLPSGTTLASPNLTGTLTLPNGTAATNLNAAPFSITQPFTMGAQENFTASPKYTYSALNFYVATAGNGGSDSNDCLAATVTGGHGPCLTLSNAVQVAMSYDFAGTTATINVGTGTFVGDVIITGQARGLGGAYYAQGSSVTIPYLKISGNGSGNTIIDNSSASNLCGTIVTTGSTYVVLANMTVQASTSLTCSGNTSALFLQDNSYVALAGGMNFGSTAGQHMHTEGGSVLEITAAYTISGSALNHWAVGTGSKILLDGYAITCAGSYNFSNGFAWGQSGGVILVQAGTTFSGCSGTTGPQYELYSNAVLDGAGSLSIISSIPGSKTSSVRATGAVVTPYPMPVINTCANGSLYANSDDDKMLVSFTGANSTCSINFAYAKQAVPICTANTNSASIPVGVGTTLTTVTLNTTGLANGSALYIFCRGAPY